MVVQSEVSQLGIVRSSRPILGTLDPPLDYDLLIVSSDKEIEDVFSSS